MSVMISVRDDEVVLALSGVIDLAEAPALHAVLTDAIDAGFSRLCLDISRVELFTAAAMGVVVSANRRIALLSGSIRVIGASDLVRTEFEITGLVGLLG